MATTETVNPRFVDIDSWPTDEAVEAMLEGQLSAIAAIKTQVQEIARASEAAADRLMKGGRLVYVGAGTSGRIAVQDGVELGPTFGWPQERLAFVLAGGLEALAKSAEGAEDDADDARAQLDSIHLSPQDVVIGVAASGKTPFTVSAIKHARSLGALTVGVANNRRTALLESAEHGLLAETGSELIAGSTRMKAGTAQKGILNLLSTATMLRCGLVYRGLMVNMIISNDKLKLRAHGMVQKITGCDSALAASAVDAADGNIKIAVLIALGSTAASARQLLSKHGDNLRVALASLEKNS